MKTRKSIYLILGIALILLNGVITYTMIQDYDLLFTEDLSSITAKLIGSNPLTIIGLFLLLGPTAYKEKSIERKSWNWKTHSPIKIAHNKRPSRSIGRAMLF